MRAHSSALTGGELRFVRAEGGLLVYERWDEHERVFVIINRDAEENVVRLPCHSVTDLMHTGDSTRTSAELGDLALRIPGRTARILRADD